MNTVAPPTKIPNVDQPNAIPEINGKVSLKPCCEPCAAQRILFGPGEKHIAIVKTRNWARSSESILTTKLEWRVGRPLWLKPVQYRSKYLQRLQFLRSFSQSLALLPLPFSLLLEQTYDWN